MQKCLPATQGTVNAILPPLPCGTVISSIDHSCQIEEFVPRKGFLAHASPKSHVRSTCAQDRTNKLNIYFEIFEIYLNLDLNIQILQIRLLSLHNMPVT